MDPVFIFLNPKDVYETSFFVIELKKQKFTMNRSEKFNKKILAEIGKNKRISPLRAIRANCLQCCGYSIKDVKNCTATKCLFYKFRFGQNDTGKKDAHLAFDGSQNKVKLGRKIKS
ncbi:hypothetical protein KKB06_01490 [Patescibacteria group bacterium]|nr:hypothetical protein [Patescibacteria group bacterium]